MIHGNIISNQLRQIRLFVRFINHYRLLYIDCRANVTRHTVSTSHMGLAVFAEDRILLQLVTDFLV